MQDSIVAYIIIVPVTIIALLILAMFLLEYAEQEPVNPIGAIPKVIFDHADNATLISVVSVGEQRYDAIHINYTVGNSTINNSAFNRYTLDTNISEDFFTLNVTVLLEGDHYMLNCTIRVERLPPEEVYIWILEEGDDEAARHRVPYRLLAEWRDMT